MDKKAIIAIAAALICLTAFTVTAVDSSSADGPHHYDMYIEVIGDDYHVASVTNVSFDSEPVISSWVVQATEAVHKAGLDLLEFQESSYGVTILYDGGYDNAAYYADGSQWVMMTDTSTQYTGNSEIGLAVNHGWIEESVYDNLPAEEKANWHSDDFLPGFYIKVLDAPPSQFFQLLR